MTWRAMTEADLDAVVSIADVVHPGFPERPDVLAEKRALYPAGALMAEVDGQVAGYALAHPWTLTAPPALDTLLGGVPEAPDCLYLHDAALLPLARGRGLARALIDRLAAVAAREGLGQLALIAVNGSVPTWTTLGFTPPQERGEALEVKLASYGAEAAFMVRRV